ncbi:MAG TPA: hypothetical protein VF710_10700 [Longimicrobium sp.]
MIWLSEWRALSDRIAGVLDATLMFLRGLQIDNVDAFGTRRKQLLPICRSLYQAISTFREEHLTDLPPNGRATIARFLSENRQLFTPDGTDNNGVLIATTTALAGFRSEMQYHLADRDPLLMRLSERAFIHLQRSIIADPAYRDRWIAAFVDGETACERLGSVHLLLHGIWAFKVSAEGERTDLVFNDAITSVNAVASIADGLVLTEWKLVRSASETESQVAQARHQAHLYSTGVLAGIELQAWRYLVIVSSKRLKMPGDSILGDITYRMINIAVEPDTPSKR